MQTLWAWFFVLVIVFRFVPISTLTGPVSAVWSNTVASTVASLPCRGRLALLWLGAVGITFASAFGFARPAVRVYAGSVMFVHAHTDIYHRVLP